MVLIRLHHLMPVGAIAGLVWVSGIACQPTTDIASPSDETTVPSDATTDPASETSADPSASTTASPSPEPAAAPQAAAVAEQSCSTTAFVVDTDPAGLNVRKGPGSDFAAVDTLPTDGPVEVSIVGATEGWFLVNEAWSTEQQELEQPGWVYAPLLGVTTTSLDINDPDAPATLYESPDGYANVKAEVPKSTEVTLLSCSGDWLQVQSGEATGWLAVGEQCGDPESPCP